jgi:hypothetical protein
MRAYFRFIFQKLKAAAIPRLLLVRAGEGHSILQLVSRRGFFIPLCQLSLFMLRGTFLHSQRKMALSRLRRQSSWFLLLSDIHSKRNEQCGISISNSRWLRTLGIAQHLEDAFGEMFVNFDVTWNRLRNLGEGIVIPIVLPTMTNEHAAVGLELSDQISSLH